MIRASCTNCGDVEIDDHRGVTLNLFEGSDMGQYYFCCPKCKETVFKDAEPRYIELLRGSGARIVSIDKPDELNELRDDKVISENYWTDWRIDLHLDDTFKFALEGLSNQYKDEVRSEIYGDIKDV